MFVVCLHFVSVVIFFLILFNFIFFTRLKLGHTLLCVVLPDMFKWLQRCVLNIDWTHDTVRTSSPTVWACEILFQHVACACCANGSFMLCFVKFWHQLKCTQTLLHVVLLESDIGRLHFGFFAVSIAPLRSFFLAVLLFSADPSWLKHLWRTVSDLASRDSGWCLCLTSKI